MTPYWQRDGLTLYQGDALAVLRELARLAQGDLFIRRPA